MRTFKEFNEDQPLQESRRWVGDTWVKFFKQYEKDVSTFFKFIKSPYGTRLDDPEMQAFIKDMESVWNKHLVKNQVEIKGGKVYHDGDPIKIK